MSQESTGNLSDRRSFEERVFARFDAIDARFDGLDVRFLARFDAIDERFEKVDARFDAVDVRFDAVDARLDSLDSRAQNLKARALDTKLIWERALVEILNVKERVENIERKFDVLTLDMMQLRGDQRRLQGTFDEMESKSA